MTGAQALGLAYPASMTDLALLQTIAPDMSPVKTNESKAPESNHETANDRSAEAMTKVNPLFADLYT